MDDVRRPPIAHQSPDEDLPERPAFLFLVAGGPTVFVLQFLLTYGTAAVWCARLAGPGGPMQGVRLAIAVYTAVALALIGIIGWSGYTRHRYGSETQPYDSDTPADRHRFLGFATLLLAGLSGLAAISVGFSALSFDRCL